MDGAEVDFDQILREYQRMEPGETDTWNAVHNEDVVWASPLRAHQCFSIIRDRLAFFRRDRTRTQQFRDWLAPRTRLHRLCHPSHYVMLARKGQ